MFQTKVIILLLTFLIVSSCKQEERSSPIASPKKSFEEIFKEKEQQRALRKQKILQENQEKTNQLKKYFPEFLKLANYNIDLSNTENVVDICKQLIPLKIASNGYLEIQQYKALSQDSLDILQKVIVNKQKEVLPQVRQRLCKVLKYSQNTLNGTKYACHHKSNEILFVINKKFFVKKNIEQWFKEENIYQINEDFRFKILAFTVSEEENPEFILKALITDNEFPFEIKYEDATTQYLSHLTK